MVMAVCPWLGVLIAFVVLFLEWSNRGNGEKTVWDDDDD